jgi:hypothetical protein
MHTSVEKHSLRIAESCGTLAHASRFQLFWFSNPDRQSGSAISGSQSLVRQSTEFSSMRAPYFYSVPRRAAVFARRWSEPCSTIVCNRLMGFPTRSYFRSYFKDSC